MMNDEQIIQDIYGYIGMALSWAMKRRQRERERASLNRTLQMAVEPQMDDERFIPAMFKVRQRYGFPPCAFLIKISSVTALLMSTAGGEVASIDAWRCHFFLHVHPFMVMVHLYPTIIYVVYSLIFSMDMWICPSRFRRSGRESACEFAQDSRQMGL